MMRRYSFLLALFVLFLVCQVGPALAAKPVRASAWPPGFLPEAPETSVTWMEADAACKARGAYLPTVWQLQDLAAKTGDGSYRQYAWPGKGFWTRESLADGRGGRQFYAVAMETGHMDLFENARLNAFVCARGAGMDRKVKAIEGVASVLAPVTMTFDDAGRYCEARGKKLPSVEALKSVADTSGNGAYAARHWPRGMYWSAELDANQPILVNLGMGAAMAFPRESLQWTVCTEK